jgi:signal transduction histidine kinase
MEQVITNLINNAIKYSPNADRVDITMTPSAHRLTVIIKDYGMGIPEELQESIFSRFFRAEGLDPHMSGLGLGLYITKEIIDRHNGEIRVISAPGKGSEFQFSIPNFA